MERWNELADIIGQPIIVNMGDKKYEGKVADVDDDQILIIEDDNGFSHRIF